MFLPYCLRKKEIPDFDIIIDSSKAFPPPNNTCLSHLVYSPNLVLLLMHPKHLFLQGLLTKCCEIP